MKKIIYNMLILAFFIPHLFAQKSERVVGIFKTGKDFRDGNLSFTIDCNSKKNKILLNDFFSKKYITIKQKDSSYKLSKNSIYGYETCNKKVYRFLDKKELLLLNQGEEILIYKQLLAKPPTGRTNVTNYYFSIGKEEEVQNLTIKNLKKAFHSNTEFEVLIDKNFKYNMDLAAFDEVNKIYKVNWLLKQIQK